MQVSVESAGGLQRTIKVAVPEETIEKVVQNRLQNLTRTVKIKGFRAGKVPLNVVKQHYGKQVRQEVLGEVIQSSFYEAVSQEKLRPAGSPSFDTQQTEAGKGLEYTATFDVYPEIEIRDMSGMTIDKAVCEINDADVDSMIETVRKQQIQWEAADKAAENGDRVTVDFKGTIDGEVFQGGEGSGMSVELGKGRMIKGFEDGLVGIKVDEERTLNLTFPEEYHAKDLAGKPVQFAIKATKVEVAKLPELDAEFAKRLGVADGDLDKMRSEIRANMQRELDSTLKSKVKQAAMDKLLEANKIEVPDALIQGEANHLMNQMGNNLMNQGMKRDQIRLDPSMFSEQAERRVALGLIMAEIVKQQGIKADADKVKSYIDTVAASYEKPEEVVQWYYGDKQRLSEVESLVLEEQLVDWILGQAKVEEKKMTFSELMYPDKV
ncbi:MAG: trigger factor [Gammaproteobacteria bacterium]|nr:trigger factor [Gammaproteobacteria bacterium]MDH5653903.1 trigger factor [Gammaproteobacteria bacterium]